MELLTESEVIAQAAPHVPLRGVYFLLADRMSTVLVAGKKVKVGGKQVMYVGQSRNIEARLMKHNHAKKFDLVAWVEFYGTDQEMIELEMRYIRKFNPPWNIYRGAKPKHLGKAGIMDNLKDAIKSVGMLPDQRINHWKKGVPQNPETWAFKVYHYHLENPPCSMNELCRGIGLSTKKSHKVTMIIQQLRRVGTWQWPKRPDREHQATRKLQKAGSQYGEDVRKV